MISRKETQFFKCRPESMIFSLPLALSCPCPCSTSHLLCGPSIDSKGLLRSKIVWTFFESMIVTATFTISSSAIFLSIVLSPTAITRAFAKHEGDATCHLHAVVVDAKFSRFPMRHNVWCTGRPACKTIRIRIFGLFFLRDVVEWMILTIDCNH